MLKFNKDHWKKKAEDEYYAAVTEQEKAKSEDQHMFEWNKRYREGKWLLKGVGKVKDEQMGTILEDKIAQDKRGKYIPEEDAKKKKKAEESGVGGAALTKSNPGRSYVGFVKSLIYSKEKKKKVSRVRNARFVIKEGIAKVLVQRDVVNERDRFISNNSQHIRMLQNVRLALSRPKLPPHHSDLENLKGADPPLSAEIAAEIGARNLRTYEIPEKQRIIETLRSVDEVKEEEMARRRHWVPARFHGYMGLHRIFPLRLLPATHEALFGKHVVKETYPEDDLLPDYAGQQKVKQEEKKHKKWINKKILKIKKSKLDMARKQFKFNSSASVAPAPDNEDVRLSSAFHWTERQFEDRNSVYSHSHGEVAFKRLNMQSPEDEDGQAGSIADDSTIATSVKYHFVSDNSVSQIANCTGGQTVAASLSTYEDMPSELCYSDEFASENALRSNFFSLGSTRTNCLVRVKMERYRKVKNLEGKKIKGLSLESRRTQIMRRNEQQIQKYMRPHAAEC